MRRLGITAHWTAAVRAVESKREDRLFNDPWAEALAGAEGLAWIGQRPADSSVPTGISIRTRYFDDFLQKIALEKDVRQIVLMAAGMDTRAFRLEWPGRTRLFELDQAPVLEYKDKILRSTAAKLTCERQTIALDLREPCGAALTKAGFDQRQPSCWLFEGLLFYLSTEDLTRLLDRAMGLSVHGSYIGFDIVDTNMLTSPLTQKWIKVQADSGAPWIGTMDDPREFLAARGWQANVTHLGAPDASYNRWPYPTVPENVPGVPHFWLVTGEKA